jgi:hypothetical protein
LGLAHLGLEDGALSVGTAAFRNFFNSQKRPAFSLCGSETVNPISVLNPSFVSAFEEAVDFLRSVAEYEFDEETQGQMRDLGENKSACSPEERTEHRQLAQLWRTQTLRKLQALNILKRLQQVSPELLGGAPDGSEQA